MMEKSPELKTENPYLLFNRPELETPYKEKMATTMLEKMSVTFYVMSIVVGVVAVAALLVSIFGSSFFEIRIILYLAVIAVFLCSWGAVLGGLDKLVKNSGKKTL